ncbi:MAG TPA: type II secretion system minor pseudopilin GspH [Gammaproteobacteria bacterium]|nr:type II secretion system minor pseudopilin GspH [Gammaproteobacteria bacterium]
MIQAMHKQKGYTLVEILIVLFIISLVTSIALLSIRFNENKQFELFANKIAELIRLAEEQAMLQSSVLGVLVDHHGFQFSYLQLKTNGQQQWLTIQDTVLHQEKIPDKMQITLKIKNNRIILKEDKETPQIIISTNGDVTPFTIFLGKKGSNPRYAIIGEADGAITTTIL